MYQCERRCIRISALLVLFVCAASASAVSLPREMRQELGGSALDQSVLDRGREPQRFGEARSPVQPVSDSGVLQVPIQVAEKASPKATPEPGRVAPKLAQEEEQMRLKASPKATPGTSVAPKAAPATSPPPVKASPKAIL